jgi:predicted lysophospholipase L1 biosynthesis ABC-type transport system permease subunit
VADLPAVPRIGTGAVLADLEYLDRLSIDSGRSIAPQVWLSPRAPADVLDRLAGAGLVVVDDVAAAQLRAQLDEQGPALGLWFYVLAGCLATALAAGALIMAAAVDRARRVEDLSALRAQGLGRGALSGATLWTYPVLVLVAVLAGLAISLILWQLTGWALPLAGLDPPPLPFPGRPRAPVLAAVGLAVLAVLAGVAFVTGRRTHKEIA